MHKQKTSDKLHVIDRKTFEKIQQESHNTSKNTGQKQLKIRNAKYKTTRTTFNLFNFLNAAKKSAAGGSTSSGEHNKLRHRRDVLSKRNKETQSLKKHGKTREGGKRRKLSKLKKSILRYRQQKRQQQDEPLSDLIEATQQLESLTLRDQNEMAVADMTPPAEGSKTKQQSSQAIIIHSRRFRDYCDNCTTPLLDKLTENILRQLDRFQKRAFLQNEIKARAHRRFVIGFHETQNFLRINKVKILFIAPDCEECRSEDGLDKNIAAIKAHCQSQKIPYVFSLRRRRLSYVLYKKVPISCVAILDYDGARDIFGQIIVALQDARNCYNNLLLQNKQKGKLQDQIQTENTY